MACPYLDSSVVAAFVLLKVIAATNGSKEEALP